MTISSFQPRYFCKKKLLKIEFRNDFKVSKHHGSMKARTQRGFSVFHDYFQLTLIASMQTLSYRLISQLCVHLFTQAFAE